RVAIVDNSNVVYSGADAYREIDDGALGTGRLARSDRLESAIVLWLIDSLRVSRPYYFADRRDVPNCVSDCHGASRGAVDFDRVGGAALADRHIVHECCFCDNGRLNVLWQRVSLRGRYLNAHVRR